MITTIACGLEIVLVPSCQNDILPSNPDSKTILENDIYEPNNSRAQAYEFESLPKQGLDGVLVDSVDIDWFKFTIPDNDTGEVKLIFNMNGMSDFFAIKGCFYDESELPKGCLYLYKGPDSDAKSTFGWKCTAGNYSFYLAVDSGSKVKSGKYSIDIIKE